jgi:hypothetical protein
MKDVVLSSGTKVCHNTHYFGNTYFTLGKHLVFQYPNEPSEYVAIINMADILELAANYIRMKRMADLEKASNEDILDGLY